MDDNYSSELAALERLAQAEEVDRQRVIVPKIGDKLLVHGAEKDHVGELAEIRVTDGKTRYGVQWKETLGLAWGFAEHEVIEARNMYTTSHPQASKLDTMKAALADYDTGKELYQSVVGGDYYNLPLEKRDILQRFDKACGVISENRFDYLRTLLAVAEAARALKTAYSEAAVGVEDYELELGALFDALKALE